MQYMGGTSYWPLANRSTSSSSSLMPEKTQTAFMLPV